MRSPDTNRKHRGFTLIEVVVTAAVLAILAGIGYATVIETNKALGKKKNAPVQQTPHDTAGATAQIKIVENVKPLWHPSRIC